MLLVDGPRRIGRVGSGLTTSRLPLAGGDIAYAPPMAKSGDKVATKLKISDRNSQTLLLLSVFRLLVLEVLIGLLQLLKKREKSGLRPIVSFLMIRSSPRSSQVIL